MNPMVMDIACASNTTPKVVVVSLFAGDRYDILLPFSICAMFRFHNSCMRRDSDHHRKSDQIRVQFR